MINETNEIHGHAVLDMMASSGQSYTRDSLVAAIKEKFGANRQFVICTGGGLSAESLVDTLIERGKFLGTPEAYTFDPATKCDHD